jgi:hypothetical protein
MKQSKIGSLNWNDALKGFLVAFFMATLTGLIDTLELGTLPNLKAIKVHAIAGLVAGLSYLLKQLITNKNGDLLKKDGPGDIPPQQGPVKPPTP